MKIPAQTGHVFLPLLGILFIAIAGFIFAKQYFQTTLSQNPSTPDEVITDIKKESPIETSTQSAQSTQYKTYTSKNLKFAIQVPFEYSIDEKFNRIIMTDSKNQVIADSIGTNFSNLNDFLQNLEIANKVRIARKEDLVLDSHPAKIGFVATEKKYYILVENKIITFSTSTPDLYSDLDLIAQSFQYIP